MANEIKLYTSASLSSGTNQILSYLIKEVNDAHQDRKIVIQSIPGAEGLNSFNRFAIEPDAILFNQEDSFKVHEIKLDAFLVHELINNPHTVVVSATSNINTVDDLIALSKKRKLFHGRLSSGASSDISLDIFTKRYNIDHIENIRGYKRVEELSLALSNNEIDFAIRSLTSFNRSPLVKPILKLEVGSKWIFVYRENTKNIVENILMHCRNSKTFHDFMKKMNQNQLLCIKS